MKIDRDTPDEVMLREIGERLRLRRLNRGDSQAKLAQEAGISKRTLERIESGHMGAQLVAILRLARVLDLIGGLAAFLPETRANALVLAGLQKAPRMRAKKSPKALLLPSSS